MLETSKDILNIVLAISVASLTFFICWGLFYAVMSMKQVYTIIKGLRRRIEKIDEIIRLVKEKIEMSTSYLLLIGEGVKMLVDVLRKKDKEE